MAEFLGFCQIGLAPPAFRIDGLHLIAEGPKLLIGSLRCWFLLRHPSRLFDHRWAFASIMIAINPLGRSFAQEASGLSLPDWLRRLTIRPLSRDQRRSS